MKTKTKIILAVALVVAAVLVWGICALVECTDINDHMNRALSQEVDEETTQRIQRIDGKIEKVSFWGYLFIPKMGEYKELKAANDRYIQQCADELIGKIAALEPRTYISSEEEYYALKTMLNAMEVDKESAFGQSVLERVDNYEVFESYVKSFEELVETYKHDCSACKGTGRRSCGSCGGRGVKGVTFYEFGDWGEASYSNYDCTACDGRGKVDCGVCKDGDVYYFYGPADAEALEGYDQPEAVPDDTEQEVVPVECNMETVLQSFFDFEEDGSARHTYLMEHREELRILTQQELEEILSQEDVGLLEIDVTGGNTDMRMYRITEYAKGAGKMQHTSTITAQGGKTNTVSSTERKTVEIANQEGILKEGLSMAFQLREAIPGYYFAYRYLAGGVFEAPMYIYILCDEQGVPLFPLAG